MYPDWPDSAADLVPLPQCVGPKLKPFDFQGPQKIDFLEYLGEGRHSFVFKVEILRRIYALKLFRFDHVEDWIGPAENFDTSDLTALNTVYNYTEPFNCECRSFGRLQEAGYEELAVQCFGYLLLDERHERLMRDKFANNVELEFDGNSHAPGYCEVRSLFPGKSGRPPPIRGIVKEFGLGAEGLKTKDMRKLLRNIIQLHQLGIIHIDVAQRQLINGKLCDFSTAITTPHFITTLELNPHLPSFCWPLMECEAFFFTINDYWMLEDMALEWNWDHQEDKKKQISARAFPGSYGRRPNYYNLRSTPSRDGVYTHVDPRKFDWKRFTASPGSSASGTPEGPRTRLRTKSRRRKKSKEVMPKTRPRLDKRPPRWYLNCDEQMAAYVKKQVTFSMKLEWHGKGGLIYPQGRR